MSFVSTLLGEKDPDSFYNTVGQAPDPSKQAYTPEHMNAEGYNAQQVGPNALAGANGDTGGVQAQREALSNLQRQAKGGLNDSDKASLYNALGQNAAQAHGQQGAILQGAAARGGVNSGSALAQQLSAAQGSQQAGADAAVNVAGQAANRAQQANVQAGELGGALDSSAFAKQAVTGQAQNAINAANTTAVNRAAEYGATARNATSQFNITNAAQAKQYLAALQQQQYDNQLREAAARSGLALSETGQDMDLLGKVAGGAGSALGVVAKSSGGKIDGDAPVPGDSPKNDTVPAMLSPGEIVIPRSAVRSPEKILAFLEKETGLQFDSAVKARSVRGKV